MKTSITNKAIGADTSSGVLVDTGFPASNVLDSNTGKLYQVTGNIDLTISNIGDVDADMIGIFNVSFDANFVLELYDNTMTLIESKTFTSADWTGWKFKNLLYEPTLVSSDLDMIKISTTGASVEKYIGYIWVGDWIDFECEEKIQPFSETNDSSKITKANRPSNKTEYRFRAFNITLNKKQGFKSLRDNIELVLDDHFGKGRPMYFEDVPFLGELFFGNLDSNRVGYDFFYDGSKTEKYTAQITFGVREVT